MYTRSIAALAEITKLKKTVTFCDKNQLLLKIFFHLSILMKV